MPLEESGCGVLDRGKPPLRWVFFSGSGTPKTPLLVGGNASKFGFFFFRGNPAGLVIYTKKQSQNPTAKPSQTAPGAMGGPDGQLRKRLGLREDEEVPLGE